MLAGQNKDDQVLCIILLFGFLLCLKELGVLQGSQPGVPDSSHGRRMRVFSSSLLPEASSAALFRLQQPHLQVASPCGPETFPTATGTSPAQALELWCGFPVVLTSPPSPSHDSEVLCSSLRIKG